jgi:hypothetical protein
MQGPPLTTPEIAEVLRRKVRTYVSLGAEEAVAIDAVAARYGADSKRVAELVGFGDGLAGGEA